MPAYPKTTPTLPATGYLRLPQIVGDPALGVPGIIPVGKSTWWVGVKAGRYPKPVKLGPNTTAWRVEDIRELMDRINSGTCTESEDVVSIKAQLADVEAPTSHLPSTR